MGAATQGSLGRTGSQGSISISLVIPDSTQLILEHVNTSDTANKAHVCLKVLDSIRQSSINNYQIAGLKGKLLANYGVGETNYQHTSRHIELENTYLNTDVSNEACSFETTISEVESIENKSAFLLMLIVE